MFELLQEEFQVGIYDASGIQEYVEMGVITQQQGDQIVGKQTTQSEEPSPNESTLNSEVNNDNNVASNASN